MKKITIVALSALLVLALAGCNKKGGSSEAAKKAAANGDYSKLKVEKDPVTKKAYDFGGLEVKVLNWWYNDAPPANKAQEDQAAYREYLEKTYNFKCNEANWQVGWGDWPAEVANYCITGGDEAYVFVVDGRSAMSGYINGLWGDVSQAGIDWTKAKWNKAPCSAIPGYTFNVGNPEPRQCMFFNKRILKENGFDPDEPYNLQAKGEWTWDAFDKMCAALTKDTDNDGIIDQYAMSGYHYQFAIAAIFSNGGSETTKDANGKIILNESDNTMEAWEWTRDMFIKYNKPAGEGANWDYFMADFKNGQTAFYNNQEYDAQGNGMLADMKDDWGMVCFPVGPHGDGKYFTLNQDNMLIIPSIYGQEKVNKIMKIYDLWSDTVPGYEDDDSWKEYYYASFRDTRAVDETMQYMMDNSIPYDSWLIPNFNYAPIAWSVCAGADVASTYETNRPVLQAAIDDLYK